jgi:membrane associated rhomboid family serine protease
VFNAPWTVTSLIAVLVASHALRLFIGAPVDRFALIAGDLAAGRIGGLLTYQFVHANWIHVLMNTAFVLAFGPPVARYLGATTQGAAAFFAFFLACGAAAAGGFGLLADLLAASRGAAPTWALLGASGAASGLMGASARLIQGRGRLGSMFGPKVVAMTASWIIINAILGLSGLTPGAGGAPVAWEAHIFGYVAGLLTIGLFGRIASVSDDHVNAF